MPASTEVKYFHHLMKGAPDISAEKGSVVRWMNAVLVDGFGEQTATSVSVSGNVATVTCANHDLQKHWVISVSGATPAQLNGEHRITKAYKDTFQFETVGVADGAATGTIKFKMAPAGWKKVTQSADGFKAVYKSERLGFDQPLFMVDDTEELGYGFKVFAMSWFDNFESYDTSMQGLYKTRFAKRGDSNDTKYPWAILVNNHFFYNLIDNNYLTRQNNGNFAKDINSTTSCIQCFGSMKTTKANNKYNAIIGGLPDDFGYYQQNTVPETRTLQSKTIASTSANMLIQRDYTAIGDPKTISVWSAYESGTNGGYSLGQTNAADFAVYIQRAMINGGSVAYGYAPGLYYTPMSFKPHKTEPLFIEDVKQIQPDNLLMWWPTGQGGVYFNATKW